MPVKPEPYDVGDDITVTLTFTDAADVAADPTDVLVEIRSIADRRANAATRTLTIDDLTRAATGVYTFVQRLTDGGGLWRVKTTATLGDGTQQVAERTIEVR